MMLARKANPTEMWGVAPWGIPTLDTLTGGIQKHTVTFLGARPMVGKSALAAQIMCDVAAYFHEKYNHEEVADPETGEVHLVLKPEAEWTWVAVFLSEMTGDAMTMRRACALAGVSSRRIRTGDITDRQQERITEKLREIRELPLIFVESPGGFDEVEAVLADQSQRVGFWILDHIGHMVDMRARDSNGAQVSAANEVQRLSYQYAPSLIIAHMNRASEGNADKRPTLSNFAGSDNLGRNADLALALHRPWLFAEVTDEQRSEPQPAELIILKNRDGEMRTIHLTYNPKLTMFVETPGMNDIKEAVDEQPVPAVEVSF